MPEKFRRQIKLARLETLLESKRGVELPLPPRLARLYGPLRMPPQRSNGHVFSNFVSTIDGVVSLQIKGHSGGGDISGFNPTDRMVMGLLRAAADAVIVGSGTLEADARHVWTANSICPQLASEYDRLQTALHKRAAPLNVVVSASGGLDLRLPVFASGRVPSLIVTTTGGARRLLKQKTRSSVQILAISRRRGALAPAAILEAVSSVNDGKRILVEGGPRLLGAFYKSRLINEQFLTIAPQLAGRELHDAKLSLVMGTTFAPRSPRWGSLIDARFGGGLLFLRYSFPTQNR
jgi:riboflavin biosynthesis pyrimidine reductase